MDRRTNRASALAAFQAMDTLFMDRSNLRKIANEISVPAEDSIVLLHRLRQALHVGCKQLQTLSQSFMSFGQAMQAVICSHANILLFSLSGVNYSAGKAARPSFCMSCNSL
jgi:hypothetical protein